MRILLDHGANVDASDHRGITALMEAAIESDEDAVRVLLEHHADTHLADKDGFTPFECIGAGGGHFPDTGRIDRVRVLFRRYTTK